jgi:hypothetical protein
MLSRGVKASAFVSRSVSTRISRMKCSEDAPEIIHHHHHHQWYHCYNNKLLVKESI